MTNTHSHSDEQDYLEESDDLAERSDLEAAETRIEALEERLEESEQNQQSSRNGLAGGYLLGTTIAVTISWSKNASILWCILHGILSWFYVIYFAFTR